MGNVITGSVPQAIVSQLLSFVLLGCQSKRLTPLVCRRRGDEPHFPQPTETVGAKVRPRRPLFLFSFHIEATTKAWHEILCC